MKREWWPVEQGESGPHRAFERFALRVRAGEHPDIKRQRRQQAGEIVGVPVPRHFACGCARVTARRKNAPISAKPLPRRVT
jgi:hypothetical protein